MYENKETDNDILMPAFPHGDSRDWEDFLKNFFPKLKMIYDEETQMVTLTGLE